MGEVAQDQNFISELSLLNYSDATFKSTLSPNLFINNIDLPNSQVYPSPSELDLPIAITQQGQSSQKHPKDEWLPITESRKGNAYYAAFHILNSNIGAFQALLLPVAFATLGWGWGSGCLCIAFVWQLYTIFLLVGLHESLPGGVRHSRFLFLAMAAFGPGVGKVAALFPVMYLSGGTCVNLIITGGRILRLLFKTLCEEDAHSVSGGSGAEWFLGFTCVAILMAVLRPNLNSLALVSLVGGMAAVSYCTLFWALSVEKGRPIGVSYGPTLKEDSPVVTKMSEVMNAVGIILVAFRGHNVLLEIQGTLPSNIKVRSKEAMQRGVCISYVVIVMCVFPLSILGFWAYGNQIPNGAYGGVLPAFEEFHRQQVTKFTMGAMYMLLLIHCLCSYQVYAMPVFDNLELRYTSAKNKRCSRCLRTCFRLFFGAFTFFIAVTFPFLPTLALLLGGMTLVPLTYAYPCFMWLAIKKPRVKGAVWCFNLLLGCFGMLLAALLVASAIRNLAHKGLKPNFFRP